MASKTSRSRKLKRKSLPKFEADVYSKIPSDGLIVFAVHYLIEHKIEITLEDIVSLCFLLFPHKFGLKKYPRWPDSAPISRHWGDVRRKRYVTANDYLGYRLTTKGIRLVKKVAKVLGVAVSKPIKKIQPAQPKRAVVIPVEKTQSAVSEKKSIKPVKKVRKEKGRAEIEKKIAQLFQEEKTTPPAPIKKTRPVRAKKVSLAPVKQVQSVIPVAQAQKAQPVRIKKVTPASAPVKQVKTIPPVTKTKKAQPAQEEKATTPVPVKKVHPARVKKAVSAPVKQAQKPEVKAKPIRKAKATPPAPINKVRPVRAKKAPPAPRKKAQVAIAPGKVKETKPAKHVIIQHVKVEKVQAEAPSKEAKERAGKFTRMMERSDAYIQYKKNGSKSNISEFDFRSLLLCTMESSAETLARNVELFKGYAEIHHRQDLIAFMIFCEEKFSHLLKPARKAKK